jgi:hypothetical protein
MQLLNGAVRRVYDIRGKLVRGLDDIVDGGAYIATGGEFFKRAPYIEQEKIHAMPPKPRKTYGTNTSFLVTKSLPNFKPDGRKETPIFTTNVNTILANRIE